MKPPNMKNMNANNNVAFKRLSRLGMSSSRLPFNLEDNSYKRTNCVIASTPKITTINITSFAIVLLFLSYSLILEFVMNTFVQERVIHRCKWSLCQVSKYNSNKEP